MLGPGAASGHDGGTSQSDNGRETVHSYEVLKSWTVSKFGGKVYRKLVPSVPSTFDP